MTIELTIEQTIKLAIAEDSSGTLQEVENSKYIIWHHPNEQKPNKRIL